MESIGQRIKAIRKIRGMTQREFSSKILVSPSHIANIENGKDNPSSLLIRFISNEFIVPEEWIKTGL